MEHGKRMVRKQKKRKKRRLRRLLLVLLLFLLSIVGYSGYVMISALSAANSSYEELERGEKSNLRLDNVEITKDPFSVLLMGIEDYSSGGANGRTDSLLVATFNPNTSTMKLLSIPRDTEVYIEKTDKVDKINHAYAYGGKEETIKSVEHLLEIPIDYYATVNFQGFKDIIDEIGGVTIEVPFDFKEKSDEDGTYIQFTEGEMHLNGEEALAYARMRKQDPRGDFGRNDRQKQIIMAAIEKMTLANNLFKIDEISNHIGNNVQTNIKVIELLALQNKFSDFNSASIETLTISGNDDYKNGVYYFKPDELSLTEIQEELRSHLDLQNLGNIK
ncbi:LCP family protein [Bacillus kexueae]|uniref:LCP family protein n=1 Tax=Aeribacillus kexueae TaxID=2078952 RepID=UPI001FAFAEB8|nr:LCP family protein [Bacillus kexueae]